MDLITNDDWQWAGQDYKVAFATTNDPRVLAVIEREGEWGGGLIEDDGAAPAFYLDGGVAPAGSTFMDDESERIAKRWVDAHYVAVNSRYGRNSQRLHAVWRNPDEFVRRYMRIFHGTVFDRVRSSIDQNTEVLILSTPTWRKHIGGVAGDELRLDALGGDVEQWTAALGGDCFGIGWASNVGRVMDQEEDIDPTDGAWTMSIECWRFLGEQYAKDTAADFECGDPDLDPMLDFDEPGFVEHSDRMAESAS